MPLKPLSLSPLYTGTFLALDWNQDFDITTGAAYLDNNQLKALKDRFSMKADRAIVLKGYKSGYVRSVLYGAMVKRVVGGGGNFTKPAGTQIAAVELNWYLETATTLLLKVVPLLLDGTPATPRPDFTGLITYLENANEVPDMFTVPSRLLVDALKFPTPPSYSVQDVIFYPVTVELQPMAKKYPFFGLATLATGHDNKAYAFAPPCPPFCYGIGVAPIPSLARSKK